MNILTKISVVLLLVLALFASGVFISASVVPDNWRKSYQDEHARYEEAYTMAGSALLALRNVQLERDKTAQQLALLKQSSDASADQQAQAIADANTKLAAETAKVNAFTTSLTKLEADVRRAQDSADIKDKIITDVRAQLDQLNKQNTALLAQVNQGEGENDRLKKLVESLQVALQDLKEQLLKAMDKNQPSEKPVAVASDDNVKVEGQVTGVNGDIASINVGSTKGIKKGMTLVVYRDRGNAVSFLAHLQITNADLSESAGIVVDRDPAVRIVQGDQVKSK